MMQQPMSMMQQPLMQQPMMQQPLMQHPPQFIFKKGKSEAQDDHRRKEEADTKHTEADDALPASDSCLTHSTASSNSPKGMEERDLPPAVFDEDEVDGSLLNDCEGDVPEPQFESLILVDAPGKKCTSVVGSNGDYRSGMAREAVSYLLKNSMAASKAKAKQTAADNSTAAPSTVASGYASPAPPAAVVDESQACESPHGDEWAADHFAASEDDAQSVEVASAASAVGEAGASPADDECRSYVTSIFCPPVVPPVVCPTNDRQEPCAAAGSTACIEVETKEACDQATCVGISNAEDVCSKGHDLRWHAWNCAICDKRGYGLRFGCVECHDANLCVACKKTSKASEAQSDHGMNVITKNEVARVVEAAHENGNSNRGQGAPTPSANGAARSSSSRKERPVGSASKSVLSVQPAGTSSAAQLLGGLTQQQGSKPRSSSRTQAGESKSVVGAAGSTQRRSGTGQRAGGSVLSVKHTSSSAAAGLLGPLLEQKAK
jgi:hypothetical protein